MAEVVATTIEKPKYSVPEELMAKIDALKESLSRATGKIPIIEYGKTPVKSEVVEVRFRKRFDKPPMVVVFYTVPGKIPKVSPVEIPRIQPISMPKISISPPEVQRISFTPKIATFSIPKPPRIEIGTIKGIPVPQIKILSAPSVPKISISNVKKALPPFTITIPRISRPDFRYKVAREFRENTEAKLKSFLGNWGWANWIRDKIVAGLASMAYWWGYIVGLFLNIFWDTTVKPQVDRINYAVNNAINTTFARIHTGLTEQLNFIIGKLNETIGHINKSMDYLRKNVSGAMQSVINNTIIEVNKKLSEINNAISSVANASQLYALYLRDKTNENLNSLSKQINDAFALHTRKINEALFELSNSMTTGVNKGFAMMSDRFNASSMKFSDDVNRKMAEQAKMINLVIEMVTKMAGFVDGKSVCTGEPEVITEKMFRIKVAKKGGELFWLAVAV